MAKRVEKVTTGPQVSATDPPVLIVQLRDLTTGVVELKNIAVAESVFNDPTQWLDEFCSADDEIEGCPP